MKFDLDDTPDRPTDLRTERKHAAVYLEDRMAVVFEDEPDTVVDLAIREGYILAIETLREKA